MVPLHVSWFLRDVCLKFGSSRCDSYFVHWHFLAATLIAFQSINMSFKQGFDNGDVLWEPLGKLHGIVFYEKTKVMAVRIIVELIVIIKWQ